MNRSAFYPPLDSVAYQVSVRLDMNEITATLSPEQISAMFRGIAQVLSATHCAEEPDTCETRDNTRTLEETNVFINKVNFV